MKWSYGVTTVPERFYTTLKPTLESLRCAGFHDPRLFVDGASVIEMHSDTSGLIERYAITTRERVRTFGNWILAAWELYLRDPHADRYAIFQDDLLAVKNLRQYLEHCAYPAYGYWNLYTFPENEEPKRGWYPSNQLGKGAVGLVFDRTALQTLLASSHIVQRPTDVKRGHLGVDGAIVAAMSKAGYSEYVHNPSLLQHADGPSSMGNGIHQKASTFPGEDFDAMSLAHAGPAPVRAQPEKVKRIGLCGANHLGPVGELNTKLVELIPSIKYWLTQPHDYYPDFKIKRAVDFITVPNTKPAKVENFVRHVDVVLFCGPPPTPELLGLCERYNRRVVCVPFAEDSLLSVGNDWTKSVSLFICRTEGMYHRLKSHLPCTHYPWSDDPVVLRRTIQEFIGLVTTGQQVYAIPY